MGSRRGGLLSTT